MFAVACSAAACHSAVSRALTLALPAEAGAAVASTETLGMRSGEAFNRPLQAAVDNRLEPEDLPLAPWS